MRHVYSDDYMGRRFDQRSYNCWSLVREVWVDMTGVDLGDLTPDRLDAGTLTEAADDASDGGRFLRIERPRSPCIALFKRRRDMPHVGVMLRGRLLHITPQGVRHQALTEVVMQFASVEYYVPAPSSSPPREAA